MRRFVVGVRGEAARRVLRDLLQRLDRLDAVGAVEHRLHVLVEPAVADRVQVPVRLVHGRIDRLQGQDRAGALRAVELCGVGQVVLEGLGRLDARLLEQIRAVVEEHHVDRERHGIQLAVVAQRIDRGLGNVVEVVFLLVLLPVRVERLEPAGLGEAAEHRLVDVDDVERVGAGGERDGRLLGRLVDRHQADLARHLGQRLGHLLGEELERWIAVADDLHGILRQCGDGNRHARRGAEQREHKGLALPKRRAAGFNRHHWPPVSCPRSELLETSTYRLTPRSCQMPRPATLAQGA